MANGNGGGPGFAFGFGLSNVAVAVIGSVAIGAIGAHLLQSIFAPKPRHYTPVFNTERESIDMADTLFGEVLANTSHPSSVTQNADRVHTAIKQRLPRIKYLLDRKHRGEIGSHKIAEGIHNNAQDIIDELGIPSNPHPAAMSPNVLDDIKRARKHDLANVNVPPGGLILNPFERRYADHQAMSYQGITDPVMKVHRKEQINKARQLQRLQELRADKMAHDLRQDIR